MENCLNMAEEVGLTTPFGLRQVKFFSSDYGLPYEAYFYE